MFDRNHGIAATDPDLWNAIRLENQRQEAHIELIASENYASPAVMAAQGSQMTNKYAEGYPGRRYYGGCEYVDVAEQLAIDRLKRLFGAECANVQPHSGAQANEAVFLAFLKPGDTIMGMSLAEGGHLTHGMALNMSGKWFNVVSYGLDEAEAIDYDAMERKAHEHKPKLIIAGASAYSLRIDWARFAKVAQGRRRDADGRHGALLRADRRRRLPEPGAARRHRHVDHPQEPARTARRLHPDDPSGTRKPINSAIFPGLQGGPLMHVIAAKAVAFQRGAAALVQRLSAAGRDQCERARADADRARLAHRVRAYRVAPDAGRPARQEDHRQGGRARARRGAHHLQQELDPERSGEADGDQRHPGRARRR